MKRSLIALILAHLKHLYRMSPMMPLSLLSSVEVGEVTVAWLEGTCLTMLLTSPPAGGCSVEHGDVLLLARLDEGEILWKRKSLTPLSSSKDMHLFITLHVSVSTVCSITISFLLFCLSNPAHWLTKKCILLCVGIPSFLIFIII